MSTIMRFSARSFSDSRRRAAWASSSSGVIPRAAVPFIGRVVSRPASRRKKSSGEAHTDREAAEVHERTVAGPLRRQQPGEERERLLGERGAEREGEVDLVGVAPGDALVDAGEGPGVAGLVERGLPASGRGRGARVGPRRLGLARRIEDTEPDERGPVGIGRPGREAEGRRRLVGQEARHEAARGERRVRLLERRAHARRVARFDRGERRLEQQEAAAVLDEGEGRGRRGLWAHGLRAS